MNYNFPSFVERRGSGAVKWDMMPEGRLPLWVADMDFAVAPEISAAIHERAQHPVFGYALPPESLYEAFLAFQQRRHRRNIPREHCLIVPGVMPALRSAVELLSGPGDAVLLQPPVYPPFFDAVTAKGRRVVESPLLFKDGEYSMDLPGLEQAFREGVRLMLLCSPHNPVGRVWTPAELSNLAELCARYGVSVIADEIHADLRHNGDTAPAAVFHPFDTGQPGGLPHTISLVSPSKTFNIPGASVAFAVVPDQSLRRKYRAQLKAGGLDHPHIFGMVASEAAYRAGDAWLDAVCGLLTANLHLLERLCAACSLRPRMVRPEASFIAWVGFHAFLEAGNLSDQQFQERLRTEAELELSHGPDFGTGGAGFQRINIATSPGVLEECFRRLERLA